MSFISRRLASVTLKQVLPLSDVETVGIDLLEGGVVEVGVLTKNAVLVSLEGGYPNTEYSLLLTQDATGGRTFTLPDGTIIAGWEANKKKIIPIYFDGTSYISGAYQGQPGVNGTNGTNGTNGVNGKSAYQVAVDNGFVGTEVEWTAALSNKPPLNLTFAQASSPFSVAGKSSVIIGTLTGNLSLGDITGMVAGQIVTFKAQQDTTGGRSFTPFDTTYTGGTGGQKVALAYFYDGAEWIPLFENATWHGVLLTFGDSGSAVPVTALTGLVY